MQTHEIPAYPYERMSMDLCDVTYRCIKRNVIVDQFSDWIDLDFLEVITAASVISMCRRIFAANGMPKIVVTDNARQIVGNEFVNFAHDWNFKHVTSSPYHQQANEKAKSAVKIVKNTIKKSNMSNKYVKRQ
jgi:hypothetical protein